MMAISSLITIAHYFVIANDSMMIMMMTMVMEYIESCCRTKKAWATCDRGCFIYTIYVCILYVSGVYCNHKCILFFFFSSFIYTIFRCWMHVCVVLLALWFVCYPLLSHHFLAAFKPTCERTSVSLIPTLVSIQRRKCMKLTPTQWCNANSINITSSNMSPIVTVHTHVASVHVCTFVRMYINNVWARE